jgi:hypothetical protein
MKVHIHTFAHAWNFLPLNLVRSSLQQQPDGALGWDLGLVHCALYRKEGAGVVIAECRMRPCVFVGGGITLGP